MVNLFKIVLAFVLIFIIYSCQSTNYMRFNTFFQSIHDSENLDTKTKITVPDQSLSVRDILMRYARGQLVLPDIETGEDDDIDSILTTDFDDIVDAHDSIGLAVRSLNQDGLKRQTENREKKDTAKQSDANPISNTFASPEPSDSSTK